MSSFANARRPTPLRAVRSTIIISGLVVLRELGWFEAYREKLAAEARERVLEALAGTWMPVDDAMKHYEAADSLGLSPEQSFAIGAASGRRFQATLWGALLQRALAAGAAPSTVLGAHGRLWPRCFDGGGFSVTQSGPKEATIELRAMPPARFAYFRNAYRGANYAGLSLFSRKVYVRELPKRTHSQGFALRVSWV